MDRRHFLHRLAGAALLGGCRFESSGPNGVNAPPVTPLLTARPRDVPLALPAGVTRVTHDGVDIVAYLPSSAVGRRRVPVAVFLHGALRTVEAFVAAFEPLLEETGVLMVAPYAAQGTWDVLRGVGFGPDVARLNAALEWTFASVPVDPTRLALTGFSDGATYTLALGRANGTLFTRLVAYSPGGLLGVAASGKPHVVGSDGTEDSSLSYANSRDVIVPQLRALGYEVDFRSFTGDHAISFAVAQEQMRILGGVGGG